MGSLVASLLSVVLEKKAHLASTAAVCIIASFLRCMELPLLFSMVASPASAVALLGLVCVGPLGFAYYTGAGASLSSSKAVQDKASAPDSSSSSSSSSQAQADSSEAALNQHRQQHRLAQPPFTTNLSLTLQTSSSPMSSSSSSGSRGGGGGGRPPHRRRLPRLSVELTPLPRLSLDFSSSRHSRVLCCTSTRSGLCPGDMQHAPSLSSGRWAPGMARIPSGGQAHEALAAGSELGAPAGHGSLQLLQQLPTFAVGEATQSLGLSRLPEPLAGIEDIVADTHLLQVGAILGEASARGALAAREAGGPVGHPSSFYGSPDGDGASQPWELLVSEGGPRLLYWGWRRPLRCGLYMYMTRSVFLDASPAELRAFMMDDAYRVAWDASISVLRPLAPAAVACTAAAPASSGGGGGDAAVEAMAAATAARISGDGGHGGSVVAAAAQPGAGAAAPGGGGEGAPSQQQQQQAAVEADAAAVVGSPRVLPHETAFMQALVGFPKPLASRSYAYARRVWPRPSDGGCYCLSRGCQPPGAFVAPSLPGRVVPVTDYCSGCVIRTPDPQLLPPGAAAAGRPAAEVFMVYFEDAHVRSGIANLGIKKGLWPMVQRTEKALRAYQAGAAANAHLQAPAPAPAAAPAPAGGADGSGSDDAAGVTAGDGGGSSASDGRGGAGAPAAACGSRALLAGRAPGSCMSRSQSLGGHLHAQGGGAAAAALLQRTASLQESSARAVAAAVVPCFPLGCDLDDEEEGAHPAGAAGCCEEGAAAPVVPDSCDCSSSGCMPEVEVISPAPTPAGKAEQGKQQQQEQQQGQGRWVWLGSISSRVGVALRQSGQLLAAVSVTLWRSQAHAALLLPSFEWRLLRWAYQRLTASAPSPWLMLGPGAAAAMPPAMAAAAACGSSGCGPGRRLVRLSSHPLAEWASQVAVRLPSHPLPVDDVCAPTAGADDNVCAAAAAGVGAPGPPAPGSCNGGCSLRNGDEGAPRPHSCAGSSFSSSAGCSCMVCSSGSCCSEASSSGSTRCSLRGSRHSGCSCSGGGSVVATGGRRHRRVVLGLVQVASVRVARRVLSVLNQPQHAAWNVLSDIDE